jgi:hypothetical protein
MKTKSSQAGVVKAFLNDIDAKSGTGNLASKIYHGVRILQHYSVVEAVLGDDIIVNRECWSRGFARCPNIPVPYRSLPITGLVGVLGYNLEALRDSKEAECPIDPVPSLEWELEHVRWVEIDGHRIGFNYGLLIDYDRHYAYIYRIVQDPWRRSRGVALMDPGFDIKIKKKVTITELLREWRRPSLGDRCINRIKSWQDLRALNHIGPLVVRIRETGRPEIRIENGVIVVESRADITFRVEGYHLLGKRGSVARVVALNQNDRVVGLWLVGRDATGQLWRTVFHPFYYRYRFWSLERLAMGLDSDDVIVLES